jgi:hypothetical protein
MSACDAVDGSPHRHRDVPHCGCCCEAAYVGLWHKADVQRLPGLGPLTGALPTFGAECRVTVAFQMFRWHAAKVGS